MPRSQMYELNPDTLEEVAQFIFRAIKPELFDVGKDHPVPEVEIREALLCGGGFIQLREDGKNSFLIVSHRNGNLGVHLGRIRGVVHGAVAVSGLWEDSADLDERRRLIGLDSIGMLVELEAGSGVSDLKEVCFMQWLDEAPQSDNPARAKVTMLDMKRLDTHTFLEGLEAAQQVATPA